jgi:1,4-dihydroxy-6-naphthoate synthase
MDLARLRRTTIAVPGTLTTAFLVLRLCLGAFSYQVRPFDEILQAVENGKVDAGLIIHEGQLTYGDQGLVKVIDLGEWWLKETGLPLPLGANGIRRDLPEADQIELTRLVHASIEKALENRQAALAHAMSWARDMDLGRADRFVGMYVNGFTLDLGDKGRRAVTELLGRAAKAGLVPAVPVLQFL